MGLQSDAVVAAAKSQLGYREGLSNDNRFARELVPALNHQPWCAIFVSWCFKHAHATSLIDGQYTWGFAGCTDAMRRFKKQGLQVNKRLARPGDIVFFDFNDSDITAEHATGSQANGNGVYRRTRAYGLITCVIRPKWQK